MKKESIHKVGKRKKPRVPAEGQDRLHQGGAHQDKKKYKREKNRAKSEENVRDDPDVFLCIFFPHIFVGGFFLGVYNVIKFEL